jgi:hypothetical protein
MIPHTFNFNIASSGFGQISAARGSDFGGSRTGEVSSASTSKR